MSETDNLVYARWWSWDLAFSQVEVLENAGWDLNDIFSVLGDGTKELYEKWKRERPKL